MNDFKNRILQAVLTHAEAHIEKHKMNVEIQCSNAVGVAEHGDHIETIEKELEQIAHYQDIKDTVLKHFDFEAKQLLKD
jgi:hypothetical protein